MSNGSYSLTYPAYSIAAQIKSFEMLTDRVERGIESRAVPCQQRRIIYLEVLVLWATTASEGVAGVLLRHILAVLIDTPSVIYVK